jgi:prepilin-type N-terminal cleavage/methylation domain-containing protein
MKTKTPATAGFSLIEVVLALAVAVFCLLPILGLLAIGLRTDQDSIRETTAATLAAGLTDDLRSTPPAATSSTRYNISLPTGTVSTTNTYLLAEDGSCPAQISPGQPTYLATVVLTPPASGTLNAATARILITWPASAPHVNGAIPTQFNGSFETVVSFNRN